MITSDDRFLVCFFIVLHEVPGVRHGVSTQALPAKLISRHVSDRFLDVSPLPTHIDWTELGAVTPVKDQGKCGNCFTFSVAGDIEGTNFLAGNPLVSLSEQQLTSCDRDGDDGGCQGSATVLDTFKYVQENKGIVAEAGYPTCSSNYSCALPSQCDPEKPKSKQPKACKKARKDGVWCDFCLIFHLKNPRN